MNILLINHYAGYPNLGMEYRPYYLSKEWVRMGHQVRVLAANYSHLRIKQPLDSFSVIDGIHYRWISAGRYSGNGVKRVCSMFCFVLKLRLYFRNYLDGFIPDLVIASSTYPLDIYPAHKIAQYYHAKLIYEVHDLWPLSPIEIGGYSKYHPFIALLQKAENDAYKFSDKVISLLPNACSHMVSHGVDANKFVYIPNGYDPEEWTSQCDLSPLHMQFISELKNKGKKVIGYAGGHAKSNALDYLLDAMKIVFDKNQNIVCLLVGNGQEKARLVERVQKECIKNVYFLDPVPKKEIPELLNQMDILYIGWEKNPLYRFGISPNKLIDYMMSRKPILHSVCAANDWVKEADCGITVDAESPREIAAGIIKMFSFTNAELISKGCRGRKFAEENLSYPFLAKKIVEEYINNRV